MTELAQATAAAAENVNVLGNPPPMPLLVPPLPAPKESEVAGAIRRAFQKMLEEPLTPSRAQKIARAVGTSIKFLRAIEPDTAENLLGTIRKPAGIGMYSPYPVGGAQEEWEQDAGDTGSALAYSPNSETFSSSAVQQFLSALPKLLGASRRSPEQMVSAIVEAKRAGLTKLAESLTKQLGIEDKAVIDEQPADEDEGDETPPVTSLCTHPGADDGTGKCPKCVALGLANPELPSAMDYEAIRALKPKTPPALTVSGKTGASTAVDPVPLELKQARCDLEVSCTRPLGHVGDCGEFRTLAPKDGRLYDTQRLRCKDGKVEVYPVENDKVVEVLHDTAAPPKLDKAETLDRYYPKEPSGPSSLGGCGLD